MLPALLAAALLSPTVAAADGPPNVVVVFIDDLGWADFSCFHGEAGIGPRPGAARTPNIDRLAAEGVRFGRFYVNSPICSPSRCALLTGQYPQRWDIESYLDGRANNAARGVADWLDPNAPTLPRTLKAAGYRCGQFGKWHLGGQRDVGDAPAIAEYGFDASLTNFEGLGPRVLPLLNKYDGSPPRKHFGNSADLGRGPVTFLNRDEVSAAFVTAAVEFIDEAEAAGEPFYVNLWPDDVHTPLFPPADRRGDGSKRALYKGVLETLDEQLGPLFARVRDDPALSRNTLIVVLSDNGPQPGVGSAGPLRGGKAMLYEGGVRSPLVVWGPGLTDPAAAGRFDGDSVFSALDLTATLAAVCGVGPPGGPACDGEELPDALLGRRSASRSAPLFFRRPPDRDSFAGISDLPDLAVIEPGGRWKLLCEFDGSETQLYDLDADPGETANRAADRPEIAARLRAAVLEWHTSL